MRSNWLIRLVARLPVSVYTKLLAAFLAIVVLLIMVGAVGLGVLSKVNRHAEELVTLHRKIAAYRQLQHDTTGQLYSVASALLASNERTLEAVRQRAGLRALQLPTLGNLPPTDKLDDLGHYLDEAVVVRLDPAEQLHLILRHKLEAIEVVAELIELAQYRLEHPLVWS